VFHAHFQYRPPSRMVVEIMDIYGAAGPGSAWEDGAGEACDGVFLQERADSSTNHQARTG